MSMAETKEAQSDTVEEVTETFSGQLVDSSSYARSRAKSLAAERGHPVKVILKDINGKTIAKGTKQDPPKRPTDILKKAQGEKPSENPPSVEDRGGAINDQKSGESLGYSDASTEDTSVPKSVGGLVESGLNPGLGNVARDVSPSISSLEAVMLDISESSIGKFVSLLPPIFKSLLPLGAVAGLTTGGPVSLNGLLQLVGGAALGAAAGTALRSTVGGINSVSGLSGALGAVALARVIGSAGSTIPSNMASSYQGQTNYSGAVLANVVRNVANIALRSSSAGIPVTSQILGLTANVALRNTGASLSVPTSVLGLASTAALIPLTSLLGNITGNRVPILPTNLSLANTGILSGISQNIAPALAQNLIGRSAIANLLPPNLQRQIPLVPPRMTGSPYLQNRLGQSRAASPERAFSVTSKPKVDEKDAYLKGNSNGGAVNYSQKISDSFTLANLSTGAHFGHEIVKWHQSVDESITCLSLLAVNCLEKIKAQYPGFTITSGFRGPGNADPKSDHGYGRAADLQWAKLSNNVHLEIAQWIYNNLPVKQVILEYSNNTGKYWVHVAYEKGSGRHEAKTMGADGSGFVNGLYNYHPSRLG